MGMTMAARFKKGDVVYRFYDYDHGSTCAYEKLVITSFGVKQGTAYSESKGQNHKCRLYAQDWQHIVQASEISDIDAFAMALAEGYRAKWTKHYADRAHSYSGCAATMETGYHEALKKACAAMLETPIRVKNLDAA
jgi:hypothetical protein